LLVLTPEGSCCEIGGAGTVDWVEVGNDGVVGGGGMSTAGGLGSAGGLEFVVAPVLEEPVLEDPVLEDPVLVDAAADESLAVELEFPVLEAEVLGVEPFPLPSPPPPQAASNVATAKPISVFLYTFFFPSRPVRNDC